MSRRSFVHYSAGVLASLALPARLLAVRIAQPARRAGPGLSSSPYDLVIDRLGVNFTGARRRAVAISDQVPGPLLRLREGEHVVINVTNRLEQDTSVHWHGLLVPADMDGVPGISFPGIHPGETFTYRFKVRQSGTYWYHSHTGFQEQQGMYAPIIIDPAGAEPYRYDRDHVVMLSDWTDEDPVEVLRNLKGDPGYYNFGKRTAPQFFGGLFRSPGATLRDRLMWGKMRMDPTDIADVSGATYTYLVNGRTPPQNWTALFRPGERVRLRFINAAAMTYFDVKIPGLRMTVVQADGQDVEPVAVDELRMAVAETYDVLVEPEAGQAYTIFAQSLDRSGYARGTLSEREGASAPIPPFDPRPLRTMPMTGEHGGAARGRPDTTPMPEMADMPGMAVSADTTAAAATEHARHGRDATAPWRKLDYRDLKALAPNTDLRPPDAEVVLRLTGDMSRYFWTINDKKLSQSKPVRLRLGQRVRLKLVNETMMEHPMHLHGVFVELQNGQDPAFAPRKHTVSVRPFETVELHFTAGESGPWAFHCHLFFHMATGMFVKVVVEPAATAGDEHQPEGR